MFRFGIFINCLISERPEEPYDARSLYDRLKEQKDKKDLEFEEAHKLSKCMQCLHSVIFFRQRKHNQFTFLS